MTDILQAYEPDDADDTAPAELSLEEQIARLSPAQYRALELYLAVYEKISLVTDVFIDSSEDRFLRFVRNTHQAFRN